MTKAALGGRATWGLSLRLHPLQQDCATKKEAEESVLGQVSPEQLPGFEYVKVAWSTGQVPCDHSQPGATQEVRSVALRIM
jgi:hypothetical protein